MSSGPNNGPDDDMQEQHVASQSSMSRANALREESNAHRNRRRGSSTISRSKASIWTTLAIERNSAEEKAVCSICSTKIALFGHSSSNILTHYRKWHRVTAAKVDKADSLPDKRTVMEEAVAMARRSQSSLTTFAVSS